jgi:hypothetical protein
MQPSGIMFHWTSCIGIIQSVYLAYVHPPTLLRVVYTGTTLVNVYHYGLSAQLHEPSRQTMRLYVPDDEQRILAVARAAKWTSRGLHVVVVAMDVAYIVLITDSNIWLSMMMFVAVGFYPALKLLRRCAPEINTTVAQRLLNTRSNGSGNGSSNGSSNYIQQTNYTEYSLLDDSDHRDAVQQRFMMKQVPRMLAMIALGACHMALMLDVRNACSADHITNSNSSMHGGWGWGWGGGWGWDCMCG